MKTASREVQRQPKLGAWAIGLTLCAGLGLAVQRFRSESGQPSTARTEIPRGVPPKDWVPPDQSEGPNLAENESACPIPDLPGGLVSRDIEHRAFVFAPSEDPIEEGVYRLVGAYAAEEDFAKGRWSMALDLAAGGEGVYYRRMGFSGQASRIRWSAEDGVFRFKSVCPQPEKERSFPYAVQGGKLQLKSEDGNLIVLEPYADSHVRDLTPLHETKGR